MEKLEKKSQEKESCRRRDRKVQSELTQHIRMMSGVQEIIYSMIMTKGRCVQCGEGKCQCQLLASDRGQVRRVNPDDPGVATAQRVVEEEMKN